MLIRLHVLTGGSCIPLNEKQLHPRIRSTLNASAPSSSSSFRANMRAWGDISVAGGFRAMSGMSGSASIVMVTRGMRLVASENKRSSGKLADKDRDHSHCTEEMVLRHTHVLCIYLYMVLSMFLYILCFLFFELFLVKLFLFSSHVSSGYQSHHISLVGASAFACRVSCWRIRA